MERGNQLLETEPEALQHLHRVLADRVVASQAFRSSARLRDFLLYVVDCELRNAPEEATEQHIGIHVFQRPPGYNSAEDSIVRTHARSLRQKLADYFQNEGTDEKLIMEIPKGHYLPVFVPRHSSHAAVAIQDLAPTPPRTGRRSGHILWWSIPPLALAIVAVFLLWWHVRPGPESSTVQRFWGPFFAGNGTLVIYSNALFVGDSKTGLRYAPIVDPHQPLGGDAVDTYTGVGELGSVYDLTRLFDRYGATFTLKRSMLVEWDEAKTKDLVFIGSVAENPALRVLPADMDFTISSDKEESRIVNHRPRAGELAAYSRPEHPLTRDYAVIAMLPGLSSGRRTLVFSGLMTLGTQAAVEFASRPDSLQQIMRYAGQPDGSIRPFEAVLETELGGGVPLRTRLVTIHVH